MHTDAPTEFVYRFVCMCICISIYMFGTLSVKVPVHFCMKSMSMLLLLYRKCSSDYFQLIYIAFKQLSSGQ